MNSRNIVALVAATTSMFACGEERISGGGDEMGNFVRVSLVDSTGAPAAGARIVVRPSDQILSPTDSVPAPWRSLVAGPDGVVEIPSLGTGHWTLAARLGNTGRAETLSTESGKAVPAETLSLGRLSSLSGHVEPAPGGKTWISLAGQAAAVEPDSLGNFRLDNVTPGVVGLVAATSSGIIGRKDVPLAPGESRDLGSFASDWSAWSLRKTIWLNTGSRGVATTSTVTDLPIALNLTNSDFDFSKLRSDFSDLRATRPDGRPLPLSIERWDAAAGTLTIWIRMDTVHAGRDSQAVVLRGGNPSARASWANPFDPGVGWSGVWHMGQNLSDATGSGHDADDDSSTYKSGGMVGECRWFTRSTPGTMSAPGSGMDADPRGDLTLETWVRLDTRSSNGFDPIVSRGNTGYRLQRDGTTNFLSFAVLDSIDADTATVKATGTTNFADGQFHHVVGMRRGDTLLVFVDGVRDGQKSYNGTTKRSSAPVGIGANGSLTWEGMIDELRIGRVARSDDWIRLSYEAQKKTSAFVSR